MLQKRFKTGEPLILTAEFLNSLIDVVERDSHRKNRLPLREVTHDDHGKIWVKNTTGSDCARFAVLGIGDSVFDPAESEDQYKTKNVFEGVEPVYPDHFSNWVIILKDALDDEIVPALRVGRIVVNLQLKEEWHKYADISDVGSPDDTLRLVSGDVGFARILHVESGGTGDKWATIDVGDKHWDRNYQLKDAQSVGTPTNAYVRKWGDSDWEKTDKEFVLGDGINTFTGDGADETHAGEKGWCRWNPYSKRFEDWQEQCVRDAAE